MKKLINEIDLRHQNVNLVGCRRFGKTSVMECLVTVIRGNDKSRSFPIFVDTHSWNIGLNSDGKIGTSNVYRYLLAILLEELTKAGYVVESEAIRDIQIFPVNDRHQYYESIKNCSDSSIADTFADIVRKYSVRINKTIALLFDEYEHLMYKGFGEPNGFGTLRKLSSDNERGFRYFSYLVAGAITWEHLCSSIGSKELNTIGSHIHYVRPLKREDFTTFWNKECDKIDDEEMKELLKSKCDFAYQRTGGVPFHANDLGAYLLLNDGEFPEGYYTSINEVFDSLNYVQKDLLYSVILDSSSVKPGGNLIHLRNLGLVPPTTIETPIGLLKDWIIDDSQNNSRGGLSFQEITADAISKLIIAINDTVYNKGYEYMFTPQNHDPEYMKAMKTACVDKPSFKEFIDAIWKTHFERTKDEATQKSRDFLPTQFQKTKFTNIVSSIRNTFYGHLYGPKYNTMPGQLSKEEAMFALVGTKNEPCTEQDYMNLQNALLDNYKNELTDIMAEVRQWENATA